MSVSENWKVICGPAWREFPQKTFLTLAPRTEDNDIDKEESEFMTNDVTQ
jgi:hypothetical protein